MSDHRLIVNTVPPPSLARVADDDRPRRAPLRVGAVQERWHPDPDEHEAALTAGHRARGRGGRDASSACRS